MKDTLSMIEYFTNTTIQAEKQIEIANFLKYQFECQVNTLYRKSTKYYIAYMLCLVSFFEFYFINSIGVMNLLYKVVSPIDLTFKVMFISSLLLFLTNKFIVSITLRRNIKKIEVSLTQCLVNEYGSNFNDVLLVADKRIVKKAFSLLPYKLSALELITKFGFKSKVASI